MGDVVIQSAEDKAIRKDLRVLARFIDLYCRNRHREDERDAVEMKGFDVAGIAGRDVTLCRTCQKLLAHAFVKRSNCPMTPKPACKNCPEHCYHPDYRRQIREVMKYSGRKLVLSGRLDYLFHLLF
jgi:hypothetical protein